MGEQNIKIPFLKDFIIWIKQIAVDKNISVIGLLIRPFKIIVQKSDPYQKAEKRQLKLMEKAFNDILSWRQEELHNRS